MPAGLHAGLHPGPGQHDAYGGFPGYLEALLKLAIGLPLAWYVLRIGMSLEMGAAAAILGVTAGTAVSMLFWWDIWRSTGIGHSPWMSPPAAAI